MKIASVADVKARLGAYLKETQEGPVIVTRNGKAVAVLLAVTDEDELERLVLAHSPKFQALLDKSRRQIEETGGVPHAVFWREVEAESREDVRKGKQRKRGAAPELRAKQDATLTGLARRVTCWRPSAAKLWCSHPERKATNS